MLSQQGGEGQDTEEQRDGQHVLVCSRCRSRQEAQGMEARRSLRKLSGSLISDNRPGSRTGQVSAEAPEGEGGRLPLPPRAPSFCASASKVHEEHSGQPRALWPRASCPHSLHQAAPGKPPGPANRQQSTHPSQYDSTLSLGLPSPVGAAV